MKHRHTGGDQCGQCTRGTTFLGRRNVKTTRPCAAGSGCRSWSPAMSDFPGQPTVMRTDLEDTVGTATAFPTVSVNSSMSCQFLSKSYRQDECTQNCTFTFFTHVTQNLSPYQGHYIHHAHHNIINILCNVCTYSLGTCT